MGGFKKIKRAKTRITWHPWLPLHCRMLHGDVIFVQFSVYPVTCPISAPQPPISHYTAVSCNPAHDMLRLAPALLLLLAPARADPTAKITVYYEVCSLTVQSCTDL